VEHLLLFSRINFSLGSIALVSLLFYACIEPFGARAAVATSSTVVTLTVQTGISISTPGNSSMSAILGLASNSAIGTTTWTVITNNALGYTLGFNSTSTPAMNSTTTPNTIANYQSGTPNTWVATSGGAYFGYSAFGTDVPTGTWGTPTASLCSGAAGPNATSTTLKYKGFTGSAFTVATRSATTTPSGVSTTLCYAVEQNAFFIPSGTYQATIVATATTL
jgi:hypothetical protein